MYQTTNLLCIMLIFIGIFGVPSDASPFRKFPSNKEGGYLRDAPATAEDLYKLLDKLEVAIQDVAADNAASMTIDDQFPINPEAEMMASRQLSNVSPESEPEYLDKMIYYNEYPQNERFVQEAHRVSHKGVPTPRMENCIQNEEAEEMSAYIWNAWDTTTIPYLFDSTQYRASDAESQKVKDVAMEEMKMISSQTCITFVERTTQSEYLHFKYVYGTGSNRCYVDHLGREPNTKTTVQLYNWCGKIRGYVQHELLHALGMIHEFQRPDRQSYMKDQVSSREEEFKVDTLGTVYDYSSVMNYWNNDGPQNKQNNDTEYNHQGRPRLTHDWSDPQVETYYWSKVDIYKLKRLFNCSNSGKQGTLKVKINARAQLNTEYYSNVNTARATVIVTAKKDDRTETTHSTASQPTSNPTFNEELYFGSASWQSISVRIRVQPNQAGSVDKETPKQLFYVSHGEHDLDHCDKSSCTGVKLDFEYELNPSWTNHPCSTYPCQNGGTCRFGDVAGYTCYCPPGRYGTKCDMRRGTLTVYVRNGTNLASDAIDLRVNITAYNDATNAFMPQFASKVSTKKSYERHPIWSERFDYGEWVWSRFVVEVIKGPDDNPTNLATHTRTLTAFANGASLSVPVGHGLVYIGYDFTSV